MSNAVLPFSPINIVPWRVEGVFPLGITDISRGADKFSSHIPGKFSTKESQPLFL